MKVTVLLFGPSAVAANARQLAVEAEPNATVADVRRAMLAQHPALTSFLSQGRLAVNASFVPEHTCVQATDEIAHIALVSGG